MKTFSAASLVSLTPLERERVIRSLSPREIEQLAYEWRFWARPNQVAPEGDWVVWLLLAGRGFGKTRAAGEWIRERVDAGAKHIVIAGPTARDVRGTIVEGESGILAISPPWNRPKYEPSKVRLTWPSGARADLVSADEPERFRGLQCDTFWCDELASWRYPEAWDMLQLGHRLGAAYNMRPKGIVSTTPKPLELIRKLAKDARTAVTSGATYENVANLAPEFIERIKSEYDGTRLGRQELHAEILENVAGALWTIESINAARIDAATPDKLPAKLTSIVVAVDPSGAHGTEDKRSDEIGIFVVGADAEGALYVLEDASGLYGPAGIDGWGAKVVALYHKWGADRVVGETNYGGAMVASVILAADPNVPFREVSASRAKHVRAEPVAVLFQRRKAFFCGAFKKLEEQLVQFSTAGYMGSKSPDRADAMVWGAYALGLVRMPGQNVMDYYEQQYGKPVAAQSVASSEEAATIAVADDGVEMLAPSHIVGTVFAASGATYQVEAGCVRATPDDVPCLLALGFVKRAA